MCVKRRFSPVLLAVIILGGCSDEDKPPAANNQAATPASVPAPAVDTPVPPAAPMVAEELFSAQELDQMMAPLALYPDALLAQVLMASTYPGDVADAVAWSKASPQSKGDEAVSQVANQPWDPSVQSLVAFPDVLVTLGHDPAWVQKVGDAFLAQPKGVMDSVQRLRHKAKDAGNLASNEQIKVSEQLAASASEPAPATAPAGSSSTTVVQQAPAQNIIIEPANPQVVYVPSYNPNVVYGSWPYPASPPVYYPPPPGYYLGAGLAFGTGVAVVASLWGDCDWDNDELDVDIDHHNSFNSNRNVNRNTSQEFNSNRGKWEHNAANRDGVPYRDSASREQYQRRLDGAQQREALRGRDPARVADRERARQELTQRGIETPATSNREARDRAQTANRERVQSADRERARQELTQRGIEAPATSNREARDRVQTANRERAQAASRDMSSRQQVRPRTQNSPQARQQARSRQQASVSRSRDNAFSGASSPSRAKQQLNRGQSSRAAASRPQASRASGSQVQRAPRASSRGSAGGGRRR